MGVFPPQLELVIHWAHLLFGVSHTGAMPPQSALEVHWTQEPLLAHAARIGSASAAHWLAAVQGAQVLLLQMGVGPPQVAAARHCTQVLVVASQTGEGPPQSLFAMHWTQLPPAAQTARIGSASVAHWPDLLQATQAL
jgi:hypothetical protein